MITIELCAGHRQSDDCEHQDDGQNDEQFSVHFKFRFVEWFVDRTIRAESNSLMKSLSLR